MDKAHKETDVILYKLEKALRKEYSQEFAKLKKAIKESIGSMDIDKSLTPIERYTQAQKYNRLDKIEETIASEINRINKQSIKEVNKNLYNIYKLNYKDSIDGFGVLLAINIQKTPKNADIDLEESPFDTIALDNIKDITELRKAVNRQFISSIMNGENTDKLIKRIQKITELKLSDITRIARTQTTRLENEARLDACKVVADMGYKMVKRWDCIHDNRTRPAHKQANGQIVDYDKPFIVDGEKLMIPGDANGSAGNIINCRCTIVSGIMKEKIIKWK